MLELPPSSPTRFVRSLYDVDRTKPSPLGWKRCSNASRRYVRRMGLVESFFNTMATLHEGRTDIFYRLPLSCPAHAYEQVVRRLPLAWALLCRRHPLLCAYVETLTPDGTSLDPHEAASRRHAGEAAQDGSSSFEPHFFVQLPESASDLLEQASRRLVWLPSTWKDELCIPSDETSPSDAAVAWLDQYVWNGKRRFLDQHAPFGLARLILLPPSSSDERKDQASFDLILCTAHCISDGLSVSSLAGELLQLLASPHLPSEMPRLVMEPETSAEVQGASLARYNTITADIERCMLSGSSDSSQPGNPSENADQLNEAHIASLLPPSIEATYPEFLPTALPSTSSDGSSTSASRLARTRWFWIIRHVICQLRAAQAEKAVLSDFRAKRSDRDVKEPWWGAQTKWSTVHLSAKDTLALTQMAKRKRVTVGSLLYAVAACALNTLERKYASSEGQSKQPTTTVIGFPYSTRRFLDPRAAIDTLQPVGASDPLLPPSSLGVKLGFSGAVLPPAALFSLPATTSSDTTAELSAFQVAQLWQTARQVQLQFDAMFKEPRFMHADGFLLGLERETRFRQNGVKDVFKVFKAEDEEKAAEAVASQDERRPGLTKKNLDWPGSSLNFSMVGLLDPVIPSSLALPFEGSSRGTAANLEVRQGLMFGVRNRAGEAFGTSFTFRGQLTLELGHDTVVWDTAKVEEYLSLMKTIVEAMVAFEL
ncbi:hypothetical protein EX895_006315 [Sporisorium graminicola]|uniref:Alcohol acetyltransferase n=1 Tax=Sporisorium graminicola TaxID=280036 RepID=A0A4U7KLQ2_9BASI|nr:hypothetical protein EX895_006315 [Sporisorium graminicola]TKY85235.1 hypothetical protein EX895_006315 [Sporisorium graminicola]